jgi:hypothetical protein
LTIKMSLQRTRCCSGSLPQMWRQEAFPPRGGWVAGFLNFLVEQDTDHLFELGSKIQYILCRDFPD